MRCSIVALSVVVMVLVMMSGPVPCQAQWESVIPLVVPKIISLFKNDQLEFMGHACSYTQNPSIRRLQLYYKGKFSCPSWTQIQGTAMTRNPSKVKTKAIENFLTQAKDNGLVTEETVNSWLTG